MRAETCSIPPNSSESRMRCAASMPHSKRKMLADMSGAWWALANSMILRVPATLPPIGLSQKVGNPFANPGATRSK